MDHTLLSYIEHYGYLAIFITTLLPEIGVPTPAPVEFVLLFGGYLAWKGTLSFPVVLLVGIGADFVGTTLLYLLFYFFGHLLLEHTPRWMPVRSEKIRAFANLISQRGVGGIFLGRFIPYLRGYISPAAGIIQIKPRIYLPVIFLSSVIWSSSFVVLGRILGRDLQTAIARLGGIQNIFFAILGAAILIIVILHLVRHKKRRVASLPRKTV